MSCVKSPWLCLHRVYPQRGRAWPPLRKRLARERVHVASHKGLLGSLWACEGEAAPGGEEGSWQTIGFCLDIHTLWRRATAAKITFSRKRVLCVECLEAGPSQRPFSRSLRGGGRAQRPKGLLAKDKPFILIYTHFCVVSRGSNNHTQQRVSPLRGVSQGGAFVVSVPHAARGRLPLAGHKGLLDVIRKEAWSFYRRISGVRLCWELEESKGPKCWGPFGVGDRRAPRVRQAHLGMERPGSGQIGPPRNRSLGRAHRNARGMSPLFGVSVLHRATWNTTRTLHTGAPRS